MSNSGLTAPGARDSLSAMSAPLSRGGLLWSGQHWIAYLRRPGREDHTGMVSLYRGDTSPAGAGTAAFVEIPGDDGFTGLCTDNRDFAEFVRQTQVVPTSPFDRGMEVIDARLSAGGDIRTEPTWEIVAGGRRIAASWRDLDPPLVGPPTAHPRIVFTVLVFAGGGSIELDGRDVGGEAYPRETWARTLGRPRSSCCFALAETMIAEDG